MLPTFSPGTPTARSSAPALLKSACRAPTGAACAATDPAASAWVAGQLLPARTRTMTTAIRRICTTSCRARRRDAGSTSAVRVFSDNLMDWRSQRVWSGTRAEANRPGGGGLGGSAAVEPDCRSPRLMPWTHTVALQQKEVAMRPARIVAALTLAAAALVTGSYLAVSTAPPPPAAPPPRLPPPPTHPRRGPPPAAEPHAPCGPAGPAAGPGRRPLRRLHPAGEYPR